MYLEGRGQAWQKNEVLEYLFSFRPVVPPALSVPSPRPAPVTLLGSSGDFLQPAWQGRELYEREKLLLRGFAMGDLPAVSRTVFAGTVGQPHPAVAWPGQAFCPFPERPAVGSVGTAPDFPPNASRAHGADPGPAMNKIDILSNIAAMASATPTARSADEGEEMAQGKKRGRPGAASDRSATGTASKALKVV